MILSTVRYWSIHAVVPPVRPHAVSKWKGKSGFSHRFRLRWVAPFPIPSLERRIPFLQDRRPDPRSQRPQPLPPIAAAAPFFSFSSPSTLLVPVLDPEVTSSIPHPILLSFFSSPTVDAWFFHGDGGASTLVHRTWCWRSIHLNFGFSFPHPMMLLCPIFFSHGGPWQRRSKCYLVHGDGDPV